MSDIPTRPVVTEDMIRQAAEVVATRLSANAEDIVSEYSYPMDGFELAKELMKWHNWDVSRDDLDILDEVDSLVEALLKEAEKQWFEQNNIQPPLPIGTHITLGEITGIYEYDVARYEVKELGQDGDENLLGRRIIKFEDAELAGEKL